MIGSRVESCLQRFVRSACLNRPIAHPMHGVAGFRKTRTQLEQVGEEIRLFRAMEDIYCIKISVCAYLFLFFFPSSVSASSNLLSISSVSWLVTSSSAIRQVSTIFQPSSFPPSSNINRLQATFLPAFKSCRPLLLPMGLAPKLESLLKSRPIRLILVSTTSHIAFDLC
jgi:hypothetical protein